MHFKLPPAEEMNHDDNNNDADSVDGDNDMSPTHAIAWETFTHEGFIVGG